MNPSRAPEAVLLSKPKPKPMVPTFLLSRVVDAIVCHKNPRVTYFAWMTWNRAIQINVYDLRSKTPWMKSAECDYCYSVVSNTVRERGFKEWMYTPMLVCDEFAPSDAPFATHELLETSRCQTAPIINYAWFRRDGMIGTCCYHLEERDWMPEMDEDSYERIKLSVKAKGFDNEFVEDMRVPWEESFKEPHRKPAKKTLRHWIPTIDQIKKLREHIRNIKPIPSSEDDRVQLSADIACDLAWQHTCAFSEEELEKMEFEPLCLDDDLEEFTAVRILLECGVEYKKTDSIEHETMMRIAKEVVDDQFSGLKEESEDSEGSEDSEDVPEQDSDATEKEEESEKAPEQNPVPPRADELPKDPREVFGARQAAVLYAMLLEPLSPEPASRPPPFRAYPRRLPQIETSLAPYPWTPPPRPLPVLPVSQGLSACSSDTDAEEEESEVDDEDYSTDSSI